MEEQRWTERGWRFQVASGVEVWVVGRIQAGSQETRGFEDQAKKAEVNRVDPSISDSDLEGTSWPPFPFMLEPFL